MKTKVMVVGNPHQCRLKDGDVGYIDGYVQGADKVPYAVVVYGVSIDLVPIHSLEVIINKDAK